MRRDAATSPVNGFSQNTAPTGMSRRPSRVSSWAATGVQTLATSKAIPPARQAARSEKPAAIRQRSMNSRRRASSGSTQAATANPGWRA